MIICNYLVRIYKNVFVTNRVVVYVGWLGSKRQKRKNSTFYDQRIIGYKNYGVKIYLAYLKILQMVLILHF